MKDGEKKNNGCIVLEMSALGMQRDIEGILNMVHGNRGFKVGPSEPITLPGLASHHPKSVTPRNSIVGLENLNKGLQL